MSYKIKYFYKTGDSFRTEDREELLEYKWEEIDFAKESLNRIKEHYKWYMFLNYQGLLGRDYIVEKPSWHNVQGHSDFDKMHCINLRLDKDTEIQFCCPWCGYFESLYSAEIIDEDLSFKV